MAKFCANGHQMEDTWQICPYCQKTGFQGSAAADAAKTRLETAPPPLPGVAATAPAAAGRKTVLLSEVRKAPVVGWFVAMSGEQKGEDFRVRDGQNTLGSAPDCDVVIRDVTVSGHHASIRHKDQKFVLSDLDSTNGTYLNESSESIAREDLKDNDTVRVGDVVLKFKCL
ncbi:MAG TPA: FHA domain-containing protein [Bryobacteraceae bacterium]|nr:FHA domain-containing protein [Bryobacteraceae bacterium]